MVEWHFFDKVYRRWLVVFIGPQAELPRELKRGGYKDWDDEFFQKPCQGMHIALNHSNTTTNTYCHVIWMKKLDLDTLVHELGHLVLGIFRDVGVDIDFDNQEPFTFYLEHWFTEIRKAIKKYPKGRSDKQVIR